LTPGAGLADAVALVVEGHRLLDGRPPPREVVAVEQAAVAPARAVQHLRPVQVVGDRLRDEARVERLAGRLDLTFAISARPLGVGDEPPIRVCENGVPEQRRRPRDPAAGKVDRRRAGPLVAEELLDPFDRRRDAG
jgi:hypothetical protein